MNTEFEPSWKICESLADNLTVHEAYIAFVDDPTQDQATILAQEIIKSYLESMVTRERYINQMFEARWITSDDMELEETGEFKGYMAEGIYSNVILPLLKDG